MRAIAFAFVLLAGCTADRDGDDDGGGRDAAGAEVANRLSAMSIEPGLWETTSAITDVSAPHLPYDLRRRMIGPRPSARGCIAAGQAARFIAGRACSYSGVAMDAGRLGGTMTCPDPALPRPTIATIEGNYGPRRYDFTMRMETAMPDGAAMILDISGRGRRIGDCPAAAREGGRK